MITKQDLEALHEAHLEVDEVLTRWREYQPCQNGWDMCFEQYNKADRKYSKLYEEMLEKAK